MANTCTTEICQKVIALMKEGMTQQEVCAEIGIGARTIRDWKDKRSPQYEKEFDEAYQEGKDVSAGLVVKDRPREPGLRKGLQYTPLRPLHG